MQGLLTSISILSSKVEIYNFSSFSDQDFSILLFRLKLFSTSIKSISRSSTLSFRIFKIIFNVTLLTQRQRFCRFIKCFAPLPLEKISISATVFRHAISKILQLFRAVVKFVSTYRSFKVKVFTYSSFSDQEFSILLFLLKLFSTLINSISLSTTLFEDSRSHTKWTA